jgi:hypothetical protein
MFSFLKKSNKSPVEEWAKFMSEKEFNLFIDLIESHLESLSATRENEIIKFTEDKYWGLTNLALICKQNQENDWKSTIDDYARRQLQIEKDSAKLKEIENDYEKIKEYIVTRVVSEEYLSVLGADAMIYQVDIPGTITTIMFDLGEVMQSVKPEMLKVWDKSLNELIEHGKQNVIKKYKFEEIKQKVKSEIELNILTGSDLVTTTAALLFDKDYKKYDGEYGVVFTIPSSQYLLSFPVNNLEVVNAINELISINRVMYEQEPGSVSNKLYWYHSGTYTELPSEIEGNSIKFTPPAEFIEVLNRLKSV